MKIVNLTNIKIKFLSAYELTLLNYIGNFVGPFKLGTGLKIQNLSKNYNLDLKHFLIKNINFTIYNFLIYILIFLFSLYKESIINLSLLIFSAAITITILILLSLKQIFKKNNFFQISEFISDWLFLFLIIFLFLIGSTIVFIEANIISEDTFTFIKSIFIFQGISFTNLVNITPANLGIRELALLGIGSLHSLSLKDLFNIGLIDRFCGIIATLILFIFFNLKKLILLINNKTK